MSFKTIALIVTLALALLAAAPAAAQPAPKVARVGLLAPSSPDAQRMRWTDAFRQRLRELGWEEGRNVVFESRWAHERYGQLSDLAAELVRLKVDVLVVYSTSAARAAKNATRTIPIVLARAGDPVGTGLVASLARPGGNVTGLTLMSPELSAKRLELLKEVVPTATRVAVLSNPTNPFHAVEWRETQAAAQALHVNLRALEVRGAADLDRALSTVTAWRADALYVFVDALLTGSLMKRILDFAARKRLPTITGEGEFAEAGGLMSYGPSYSAMFHRTAVFVDKILRGAKAGDLPVEQPTQFELVVNKRHPDAVAADTRLAEADAGVDRDPLEQLLARHTCSSSARRRLEVPEASR